MRIYLGGPINGRTDSECNDWRAEARKLLEGYGHGVIDPMRHDYRGREIGHEHEIVNADKSDIAQCDVLLMNVTQVSVGTSMEVFFGWLVGKQVVLIVGDRVSPWLTWHSHHRASSVVAAVDVIASLFQKPL